MSSFLTTVVSGNLELIGEKLEYQQRRLTDEKELILPQLPLEASIEFKLLATAFQFFLQSCVF